jgi:hypothetical protein
MARVSSGHCPIHALMQIACGHRPDMREFGPTGVYTATRALLCEAGLIAEITVPAEVSQSADLLFCRLIAATGDLMKRPPEGNSIVGFLGAIGTSHEDAMSNAARLAGKISVTLAR